MKNGLKRIVSGITAYVVLATGLPTLGAQEDNTDLILHYDFETETVEGVNYGAVIKNGYAYFDGRDDYIQMPDNVVSGEERVTFLINVRPEMDAANQFTFTVGTGTGNYLFLNTNNGSACKAAITNVGHWNEYVVNADPIEKGSWAQIALVMDANTMRLYVDGEAVSETTSEVLASGLGDTNQNYLAKSQYEADSYFKGYIDDFRVYKRALSGDEIKEISAEYKAVTKQADVRIAAEELEFDSYELTESITLPTKFGNLDVAWESDNERAMDNTGNVTRCDIDAWVNLTATFTDGEGNSAKRIFGFNVIHNYTDEEIARMDLDEVKLVGNLKYLKEDLYLTTTSKYGSTLRWYSDNQSVIDNEGKITRSESGEGAKEAGLYLFSTYNSVTVSKKYEVSVEEKDYAYLFAYFTGNSPQQEKLFYGLSRDGYNFNTINGGNSVLESTKGHMAMRDPFIMKGQNGRYYALFTDMRSWDGWSSQSSIIIFESEDLVHWDEGTIIDFKDFEEWRYCNRAWAPQAIWDSEFYDEETGEYGAYMIYLALSSGGATQMYKVYTKDMKQLITKPELFYKREDGLSDIDGDIVYKDGKYYMYVKDESAGGIYVVESEHAGGPYSERINALPRKNSWGNDVAIEGSGIFKLMNEDKYNIVYDAYNAGFFVMSQTENLTEFTQLNRRDYSFDFTPRHGYVITISREEADRLENAYGESIAQRDEASEDAIVYYNFDDESDKSGNFNDAQLAPSASIAQGISGGKGLCLDGTSESYATIPSEALKGLEDYTVAAWIKPNTKATTQRVFDFGTGTSRYMFLTPYYSDGVLRGAITGNSYQNEQGMSVEADVETDRWTHIAMQQEGDVMRIFIDGELVGEQENVSLDPYEIKHTIPYCYIGKSMWSGDKYFDGTIDEFYIFDRAITAEEVRGLYEKELKIACNIIEEDGVYKIAFVRDGDETECFDCVAAQFDSDGALTSAEIVKIDFSETDEYGFEVTKTGKTIRTFWFEEAETIKPLK